MILIFAKGLRREKKKYLGSKSGTGREKLVERKKNGPKAPGSGPGNLEIPTLEASQPVAKRYPREERKPWISSEPYGKQFLVNNGRKVGGES